jgi:uncharacterized membrane protein YdjX (TVP38/TMEM64 family)
MRQTIRSTNRPGSDRIDVRTHRRVRAVALIVGAVAAAWLAGRSLAPRVLAVVADIHSFGAAAAIVFILIYAASVVALIPATVLTIAGGAVFGFVNGALYSFIGGAIGSTCAFLLGRYGARRFIERWLGAMPRFAAIDRAVAAQGWWIVFLLRLSPAMPFNVLNYALGLTTISVWDFALASFGSIPSELLGAYTGKVGGEALALAGEAEAPRNASYYVVLIGGLVATLAATFLVTRTARRALRDV